MQGLSFFAFSANPFRIRCLALRPVYGVPHDADGGKPCGKGRGKYGEGQGRTRASTKDGEPEDRTFLPRLNDEEWQKNGDLL